MVSLKGELMADCYNCEKEMSLRDIYLVDDSNEDKLLICPNCYYNKNNDKWKRVI